MPLPEPSLNPPDSDFGWIECPQCGGTGFTEVDDQTIKCPDCQGDGVVEIL